jgi:hypothetical protein
LVFPVLVWSAAVLCSAALVSRLGFGFGLVCSGSGVRQCFALPLWFLLFGRGLLQTRRETKAAEQSTAALQTKAKTEKERNQTRADDICPPWRSGQ